MIIHNNLNKRNGAKKNHIFESNYNMFKYTSNSAGHKGSKKEEEQQ